MAAQVTTRTQAGTIAGAGALVLIGVGLILPAFAGRSLLPRSMGDAAGTCELFRRQGL